MPPFFDPFVRTPKQREAVNLLAGPAKHVLLYGGARSGKTFDICYALLYRAMCAPGSTHAVLRHHFNDLRRSIIDDTMPKVASICFPKLYLDLNRTDWAHKLNNGSRIYYGGLSDKERTEKILGQEHSTIYLNECSQIVYSARNKAVTRLAQTALIADHPSIPYAVPELLAGRPLRQKAFYDENPPNTGHWTYTIWREGLEPSSRRQLTDPDNYASMRLNPQDNLANLPEDYVKELEALPYLAFYEAERLINWSREHDF
jgi:phage terminase large subunit